ncbi:hypothetical protein [Streptomyces sp. NBC_01465]|uniref:hypothetical protein n=1 Tax=Streptomyces sp. NBC_01465 TaxID=2903878 RepID=UPI002E3795BB|nr:hypothetical protein [Streptomyces sp. NBC_01465]
MHVTSICTRRSFRNSGSTSRSRVADVTLCTTNSTVRQSPRVAQRDASAPTGTRTHPSPTRCPRYSSPGGHSVRKDRCPRSGPPRIGSGQRVVADSVQP